jgi:hypothetical protein
MKITQIGDRLAKINPWILRRYKTLAYMMLLPTPSRVDGLEGTLIIARLGFIN